MLGNRSFTKPCGIALDLIINVGNISQIKFRALCLDVGDKYDFLIGRLGFHHLHIGTDWTTHFWYLRTEAGIVPCEVYYETQAQRVVEEEVIEETSSEDEMNEGSGDEFFLMLTSDEEQEEEKDVSEDHRLGKLQDSINSNTQLSTEQKEELIKLVNESINCFDTDYEHLTQTDLVKLHIDTREAKPIYRQPYPLLSLAEREYLKQDLEAMVNNGILIPNTYLPSNSKTRG
ncbi:hypothetical protein CLU79DRAFT_724146 [Phycomyces nitens]|nr:hypothetical protein CLU79DRAFT_724146 [Phycomyces nitens]